MSNLAEAFCQECGSSWFEVLPADSCPTSSTGLGALRFSGGGKITGYNGIVVCFECDAVTTFPQVSPIPTAVSKDDIALVELPPLVVIDARSDVSEEQPAVNPRRKHAAPD